MTTTKPTRQEIETALESGQLWAAMRNGNFWQLRRNGATKLWKTRPADYSIPVKCGLSACARITETSSVTVGKGGDFVISAEKP